MLHEQVCGTDCETLKGTDKQTREVPLWKHPAQAVFSAAPSE